MLNKFSFAEILDEAKKIGIPIENKRNILREYLQCRFLEILFKLKDSHKLVFVGGTSLRLLRNMDRFSEDLDFDNFGLTENQLKHLLEKTINQLKKEGFLIETSFKKPKAVNSLKIKFLEILAQLKITNNFKEKLMIEFDCAKPKNKYQTEVALLNRFGVVQKIPTYPQETLLAHKLLAIKGRRRMLVRDFYDTAWLLARKVRPNLKIIKLKDERIFFRALLKAFSSLKPKLAAHKKTLEPLLVDKNKISLIDNFEALIASAEKENIY